MSAGTTAETAISITDDDDPQVTVSFGAATYTAAEGGTATVTVTLSADPERTVEVQITTTNQGGATAADYSGSGPASFDAGETSKTFTSRRPGHGGRRRGEREAGLRRAAHRGERGGDRRDDGQHQGRRRPAGDGVVRGGDVHGGGGGHGHGDGDAERGPGADGRQVPITKTNQGGATSADYSGVPATVTFNTGETSKTFDFAATADTVDDDGESVLLAFGTLPGGVIAGTTAATTVSITDDDDPQVTVSVRRGHLHGGGGGHGHGDGDAERGPGADGRGPDHQDEPGRGDLADYSGVPTSVTFNTGETSKTFDFAATADTVDDDGESVKIAFGTLPGGVIAGTTAATTVSITDDDDPQVTVSFGASTYTAAEGGTATVTVTLSADPERTVEVPITTTNQGGATSADYSGCPPASPSTRARHGRRRSLRCGGRTRDG